MKYSIVLSMLCDIYFDKKKIAFITILHGTEEVKSVFNHTAK